MKQMVPGKKDPGGPVFEARRGQAAAWDNRVVGTPWVVKMPGGLGVGGWGSGVGGGEPRW
jgi:hypothetical protein